MPHPLRAAQPLSPHAIQLSMPPNTHVLCSQESRPTLSLKPVAEAEQPADTPGRASLTIWSLLTTKPSRSIRSNDDFKQETGPYPTIHDKVSIVVVHSPNLNTCVFHRAVVAPDGQRVDEYHYYMCQKQRDSLLDE